MRLTTIWTIGGMTLRERLRRTYDEWLLPGLAHRLPRRLAYWSYIDTGVRHIGSSEIVPDVRYADLLDRMSR
ncbi:MAG: hypothetical protein ACRDQA_02835 [Nocardioidaceae bacterium]